MTVALAVVALVELGLLGWGLAQRRGVARFEKRRVVIHTVNDTSTQGILDGTYPDCFVLRSPRHLDAANPADLPGEMVFLRGQVDRMQVL